MVELFLLIIVIIVAIILIRPGKAHQLEAPIIVQCGQYHITAAPQLNGALPFIEYMAKRIITSADIKHHNSTLCFEVHDPALITPDQRCYLLAITQRNSKLYCQAITPSPLLRDKDSHFNKLMEFSRAVMASIPAEKSDNLALNNQIIIAASSAAHDQNISIKQLTA